MNGYTKTTWIDNSTPAINAENLNHIEQGIKDVTDEVINGTLHIVDVPYTAENNADSCTTPNTLYYVWVASSVVTHGKMYVLCTPRASSKMSQVALSKEGFLLIRSSQNADFSGVEWVLIPTASNVSTMINNAVSGKANSSDVYTKAQANETFVDKEVGKGLSTNDFTDSDKNLLEAGCTETKNRFNLGTDIILGKNGTGDSSSIRAITVALNTGGGKSVVSVKTLPPNLKYQVWGYNDGNFTSPTNYTTAWIEKRGQSTVVAKPYVRVLFGTINNATITMADFEGLELQVEEGEQKTDYAPKYTAFDYVARNRSYPVHLKVCSYNVGMYSNGISTDTPAADALENMSGFLGANNFDILGIQEGRSYVNGTNADETTYNDYFISQKSLLNNCAIKSQFVLKDTGEGTFTAGSRKYVYATAIIGNKEVFIINVHLALTATDRASNYTELLDLLKAHEYFIAFGDFNAAIDYNTGVEEQTQAEYNNLINAGYTVANGGRWGLLNTMGTTSKHPDNICVSKNIKMITSKTADVYATMNSDHIPIIAELVV
jgi:exonuclease III